MVEGCCMNVFVDCWLSVWWCMVVSSYAVSTCGLTHTTVVCVQQLLKAATATNCATLRYTAPHWATLHHTALHCTTLHHTAPHCTTLHHTAPYCTTLHHTATHCNTPQRKISTRYYTSSNDIFQSSFQGSNLKLVGLFSLNCRSLFTEL